MRVLLLEDNPSDAYLTRRSLTQSMPDWDIDLATTIKAAKQNLKQSVYDIALLDIRLPDGYGFEVLESIVTEDLKIPVIMLTGTGDEETAISVLRAGASDYVVKGPGYTLKLPEIIQYALQNYRDKLHERSELIHVLYIEHNQVDIDLTTRHLKQYAPFIQLANVYSAQDALDILNNEKEKSRYSVILLDYRLTDSDAFDFVKTVRQQYCIELPIIMITGHGSEEIAVQAMKIGVNDYFSKSGNYLLRLPTGIINAHQTYILKRKQLELVESERKYRLLAENAADVIFVLDMDFSYRYISPAVKKLRGYEPEEVLKQKMTDVLTPASYALAKKTFTEILESIKEKKDRSKIEKILELEMIRKDKTTVWTEVKTSLIFDERGNATGVLGVTRDISVRKQTMDELRKLTRAIEQSPVSVVITDLNGNIEYANPKFSEITGYSFEEAKGSNPRILKSGYTSDEEYRNLWTQIISGGEWRGEFQNKRKDGSTYWENAIISPIRNSLGEITHFVAVKEDVTEKKQIMKELIIQKEHAEESDRLKTAFIQNISHEIRTPLNAIVGFSSILANSDVPNDKKKEFIKIIENSNDHLLSIITGIINIATLQSGIDKLVEKETDLNNLMRNVYAQLKSSKKIPDLVFDPPVLPPKKIMVITDPVKLMQVLVNLVGNALKFTSAGYVKFGYSIKDNGIHFFVEDSGIGIPVDMQDLIFERFRQLDNSSTRKYGGTGLGLALSKGYVTLLGGNISLVSEPGHGSSFNFTIPFKPAADTCESNEVDFTDRVPKMKSVLVAEDELNSYYYIHQLLTMHGNKVVRASNGLDAINRCKTEPPDLILMDIKMPIMDGLEATTIIRQKFPGLPVIALTAFALETDKKLIKDTGFDGFIEKPVKPDKLFEIMIKVLK